MGVTARNLFPAAVAIILLVRDNGRPAVHDYIIPCEVS
jgi:hypothetical protein